MTMSNKHVLYVLDVDGIIFYIKKALEKLNQPFNVLQTIRYEPVRVVKERSIGVDIYGREVIEKVRTYEMNEVEENCELCLDIDVTDSLASRILSLLLYEYSTGALAYLNWENQVEEIAKEIFVDRKEITRNHVAVVEYLTQMVEFETIEQDISFALKMMIREPWRDWKLIHNGRTFLVYGTRDYRIIEWEQMTGNVKNDKDDITVNVEHILKFLISRVGTDHPNAHAIAETLFLRALRSEVAEVDIKLNRTAVSSVEFETYRPFFLRQVLPIVHSFVTGTLDNTLTKRIGCYTVGELVGGELVFTFEPSAGKMREEREEILEAMENQDYVPRRIRQHYAL